MKKIITSIGIIGFSLISCKSASSLETSNSLETSSSLETSDSLELNIKLAIPTPDRDPTLDRDTLYIEESLIPIFTELWKDPKGYTRPVIMPLSVLGKAHSNALLCKSK